MRKVVLRCGCEEEKALWEAWGPREVPSGRKWSLVAEKRTPEEVPESSIFVNVTNFKTKKI